MRHQKKIKKLGRTASHRKATLAAMGSALIEHKRIETTLPKAKALRSFVEPLINRAKEDSTANRRQVFRHLRSKEAVKELFGDVAGRIGDRPGGYTRVVKLGLRQGDAAELAVVELVDYNDVQPDGGSKRTRRTRRSSGRSRRKSSGAAQVKPAATGTGAPADNLTKVWGIGPVFAAALGDTGITTFAQLAEADLDTLRAAIAAGSSTSEGSANEETWAEQAALLAAGDAEAHAAYVERLKEDGGTTRNTPEPVAEAVEALDAAEEPTGQDASDPSGTVATGEPDAAEAENPAAADPAAADPSTAPDDAPKAASDPEENFHPDAPQGAAPAEGEPPPDTGAGDDGSPKGSGHRG